MDDLVLNIRQIGQYPQQTTTTHADLFLFQQGGLGGIYATIAPDDLVSQALLTGAPLKLKPGAAVQWNGASLTWQANNFTLSDPLTVPSLSSAGDIMVNGEALASQNWVQGLFDTLVLQNQVFTFNGRTGNVQLESNDILRAGGILATNPHFNGVVTVPTLWNPSDCSDGAASTAWVQAAIVNAGTTGRMVRSFNGRGGCIVLNAADISLALTQPGAFALANTPPSGDTSARLATTMFVDFAMADLQAQIESDLINISNQLDQQYAPLNSPQFTGTPTAPTPAQSNNSGSLATTAFVHAAVTASTTGVSSFNTRTGAVLLTLADITGAGGAPLASPAFTGHPTGVTEAPGDNSIRLATTAFVEAAVAGVNAGVLSFNTRVGAVVLTAADLTAVGGALLASPTFTGTPAAPTATPGTSTTQIASTAFVEAAIAGLPVPVSSFNGRTGVVNFQAADLSAVGGALLNSPAFTGNPTGVTQPPGNSSTSLATTAFVMAAVAGATAGVSSFNARTGAVTLTTADITGAGGVTAASPAFTGTPTAPTATAGTNSQQLATTAFVQAALSAAPGGVSSFNTRTGAITLQASDVSAVGGALLAGPAFTGNPTAPTAVPGTSTTQLATTAFVANAIASSGGVNTFMGRAGAVTFQAGDLASVNGAFYTQADNAPTLAPGPGQTFWFDSTHGQLYTRYIDPISSALNWVIANTPPPQVPMLEPGDRVLLASVTVTSPQSYVPIFYNFDQTYDQYELVAFGMMPSSEGSAMTMTISTDGVSFVGGANSYSNAYVVISGGASGAFGGGNAAYGMLTAGAGINSLFASAICKVHFALPWASGTRKHFLVDALTSASSGLGRFVNGISFNGDQASPIATGPLRGFAFGYQSGTINGATIKLYGIVK
jgi:hypothetical protein